MKERQVKSKKRVADFGEVFTAKREVDAMLDMLGEVPYRLSATFLDPACGDGNFLIEILSRKLKTAFDDPESDARTLERNSLIALSSVYGVEIQHDNAKECRLRLLSKWRESLKERLGAEPSKESTDIANSILGDNIIRGDFLFMRQVDESGEPGGPIYTSEWFWEMDGHELESPCRKREKLEITAQQTKEMRMAKKTTTAVMKKKAKSEQGSLFAESENAVPETQSELTATEKQSAEQHIAQNADTAPPWDDPEATPAPAEEITGEAAPEIEKKPKSESRKNSRRKTKATENVDVQSDALETADPEELMRSPNENAVEQSEKIKQETPNSEISETVSEKGALTIGANSSRQAAGDAHAETQKAIAPSALPAARFFPGVDLSVYSRETIERGFHPIVQMAFQWGSDVAAAKASTSCVGMKSEEKLDADLHKLLDFVQRAFRVLEDGETERFCQLTEKALKLCEHCLSAVKLSNFNQTVEMNLMKEGNCLVNCLAHEKRRANTL